MDQQEKTDKHDFMPDRIRDTAQAVKGIVEAVPVYKDALQPAAQQVGKTLETVTRSVNAALTPLRLLVWGIEKIEGYLVPSLSEKLKDVPSERIITPSPTVAGPALEALRFAGHEPRLRELYANLLAKAMDAETARNAHPAFVEIIKQMTPDEARLMQTLATMKYALMISVDIRYEILNLKKEIRTERLKHFSQLANDAACTYPDMFPNYLDNLSRLGLVEIKEALPIATDKAYEPLEDHPDIAKLADEIRANGMGHPSVKRETLKLTALGQQFCAACITSD